MAWKCPTCGRTFSGKGAYNRAQKHCKDARMRKKSKSKGYSKKVHTVKFGKGPGR